MKDTLVMITIADLSDYVDDAVKQASIELINDHIRPHSASKAKRLIQKLNEVEATPRRKSSTPRELTMRVVKATPQFDAEDVVQYLVR